MRHTDVRDTGETDLRPSVFFCAWRKETRRGMDLAAFE
jgi:hypothetical protein